MKQRRSIRCGGGGRPQTQGRAWRLSWAVAIRVAEAKSSALASEAPAKALRRKTRHQPSMRLSQEAPTGMKACWMRGWSASQSRMGPLRWLARWSAMRKRSPRGEAWSSACSRASYPAVLRAGAVSLQHVAVAHAQCPVDPDLLASAVRAQRHLDAVASHRPARSRREIAGRYRAAFVDADDRRARGRRGGARDDPGPFGTKSGSLLLAHRRVRRPRTPSRRKMRRTWLRATWTPRSWAAAVNVSRVHSGSAGGSGAASSPVRS
jgi:hypothetical protein